MLKASMNSIILKRKTLLLMSLFTISFLQFLIQPKNEISMGYIYFSFLNVIFSTYLYFKIAKKKNYLDFDTIFVVILLIVGFAYPVFLFNENYPFLFFFGLNFNLNNLNTGTIIFSLGVQSYYLGSLAVKHKILNTANWEKINTFYLSISVVLLSILFIAFGGYDYFRNMYKNAVQLELGHISQIMILLQSFFIVLISSEIYNIKGNENYKFNKITLIAISIIILLMLLAGNRTFASQLLLPIIVLFAIFKKNIGAIRFIAFIIVGIVFMWIIQMYRLGYKIEKPSNYGAVISDLVIPARNNYLCIEYVNKYEYTYGRNMSGGLIASFPSLERILNSFGVDTSTLGSAEVFTYYTLGKSPPLGLGTTIIADIYLSFGVPGVIIMMFLLGYYTKNLEYKTLQLSYYSIVSYAAITSYAIFWVRTTYTHPVRLLLWCFIIAHLNKLITKQLKENII